jgi:hypothetical protein
MLRLDEGGRPSECEACRNAEAGEARDRRRRRRCGLNVAGLAIVSPRTQFRTTSIGSPLYVLLVQVTQSFECHHIHEQGTPLASPTLVIAC